MTNGHFAQRPLRGDHFAPVISLNAHFAYLIYLITWLHLQLHFQLGYTSKVSSLQASLREAFRSPGQLVLGDFGFSAYFYRSLRDR